MFVCTQSKLPNKEFYLLKFVDGYTMNEFKSSYLIHVLFTKPTFLSTFAIYYIYLDSRFFIFYIALN